MATAVWLRPRIRRRLCGSGIWRSATVLGISGAAGAGVGVAGGAAGAGVDVGPGGVQAGVDARCRSERSTAAVHAEAAAMPAVAGEIRAGTIRSRCEHPRRMPTQASMPRRARCRGKCRRKCRCECRGPARAVESCRTAARRVLRRLPLLNTSDRNIRDARPGNRPDQIGCSRSADQTASRCNGTPVTADGRAFFSWRRLCRSATGIVLKPGPARG